MPAIDGARTCAVAVKRSTSSITHDRADQDDLGRERVEVDVWA